MTVPSKNQLDLLVAGLAVLLLGCGERRDTLLRAWPGMTYEEFLHENTSLDAHSFQVELGGSSDLRLLRGAVADLVGGVPGGSVRFGPGYASVTLDRTTVKSIEFAPDAAESEPRRSLHVLANLSRAGFRSEHGTATEGFVEASQRVHEALAAAGRGELLVRESLILRGDAESVAIVDLAATRSSIPSSKIGVRIETVRFEKF